MVGADRAGVPRLPVISPCLTGAAHNAMGFVASAAKAIKIKTPLTLVEGGWAPQKSFSGRGYGPLVDGV